MDTHEQARAILARDAYDYYAGGAEAEITLTEASAAWQRWRFRPRALSGVSSVSTATTLLGTPVATPIGVAPWALQRMAHPDGEIATAVGAAAAGALLTVSTTASTPLAEVAVASAGPKWFQLYRVHDAAYTDELVCRAEAAGYRALVLTVDVPFLGRRLRDLTNDFRLPDGVRLANHPTGLNATVTNMAQELGVVVGPTWTYDDLARFASMTSMPVVVKGVLRGDDARRCTDSGAAAVWVSTHGGRQVDQSVASAVALPEVVDAVGSDAEVYVDGGIRRSADVLVALALGARAVFLGRPLVWALATGGADGVRSALDDMTTSLSLTMALCGISDVNGVPRDVLDRVPRDTT